LENVEFSHEAILDSAKIGNKPSSDYFDHLDMLDNLVRDCMFVSKGYSGIKSPSTRHYYASILFTALITRSVSLAQLIPFSPWAEKRIEHWDYSSAAGITRTMLEIRISFYYLCVDKCDDNEWDCRWNLFNLHDCISRKHLFETLNDKDQIEGFESQAKVLRDRLKENSYFQKLNAGVQKKLLNGQTAYLSALEVLAERAGIDVTTFRWIYKFFSSHVHSLPMSFYRIGSGEEERGRGLPSPTEEGYTSLCMSLASTFLASTRDEVHELFSDFKEYAKNKMQEEVASYESPLSHSPVTGLEIGERVILAETELIEIETIRKSEASFIINYRLKSSGEIVLTRVESDGDDSGLEFFDAMFWNVLINGKPATSIQMDNIEKQDWAFKADHQTRTLNIKYDE
jgi:hypothetical protein